LDNTVWDGILLEDSDVTLRPGVVEALRELDCRGILHSIASRNEHEAASAKLAELGILDYFLFPQINFGIKSQSIKAIAEAINIGIDTLAFIDDQPFELDEVRHAHPAVTCIDAAELPELVNMPCLKPRFITEDSALRRKLYQDNIRRVSAEESFEGPQEAFLETLEMRFTIARANEDDLQRAVELTERTHQLNTTGKTFDYDELDALRKSDRHMLFVNSLEDRYGTYGKIGLTLVEKKDDAWVICLLLMSCRVMSRGVGMIMIQHLAQQARATGVKLQAEFVETPRNRMMYVTYRFGGFEEVARDGDWSLLQLSEDRPVAFPEYVKVTVDE
jgi:FkbH-like protein